MRPSPVTETLPLAACRIGLGRRPGAAARAAALVLEQLGARVDVADEPPGSLRASLAGEPMVRSRLLRSIDDPPGLPPGTLGYAAGLGLVCALSAGMRAGADYDVDPAALAAQLLLPQFLSIAHGVNFHAPAPVAVAGGALSCDLQLDQQVLLGEVVSGLPEYGRGPGAIATAAQEVGLPVVDFRRRVTWPRRTAIARIKRTGSKHPRMDRRSRGMAPLAGIRVCDLTAMWAGPLATWLLTGLGADVVKVEPACRPDGTRQLDTVAGRSMDSELFQALNRNKSRLDLDLREADQHQRFLTEVKAGDLVISNMSPRVPANLGFDSARLMRGRERPLVCLEMPAFAPGTPERPWRAFGHGVHAVSGLGMTADGRPWTAPAPYCDALSGLAAAAVAAALLTSAVRTGTSWAAEVPMINVAGELARRSVPFASPQPYAGNAALAYLRRYMETASVAVTAGGTSITCPRSPFSGPGLPVAERPAPQLGLLNPAV